MFNKLRNRFLMMNMIIISIIMLAAFATIYIITYQSVYRDITADLQRVSEFYHQENGGPNKQGLGKNGEIANELRPLSTGLEDNSASSKIRMKERKTPPELSVSFALHTDRDWNILSINSRFDMEDTFYEIARDEASDHSQRDGQFKLDDTSWAYRVQQNAEGNSIVYLDVSAQLEILTNLIYTFSIVALVMLVVIYLTSRYFANRSIAPVEDAFHRQKQFIADASHELKTPLAVINTNADVLLANEDSTVSEQSKWLHHIKAETERMKTLTNDLLYLTKMEDDHGHTIIVPFNLSEAVESVILTMEAIIYEKNISLTYHIEPDHMITGSNEQIKQVVMILLDNAIKYTNAAGAINLTLTKQNNHILLKVTNTGEGIPAEHITKIFDRFYRADTSRSRKSGGYGLGLAIAKSIVEQHKGKIYVKSTPNAETSFYVQFG